MRNRMISILAIPIVSATPCLLSNGAYAQGHGYEGMTQPCDTVQACNSAGPHQDQGTSGRDAAGVATGVAAGAIGVFGAVTADPVAGAVGAALGGFSAGTPAMGDPGGAVGDANAAAAGQGAAPGDN
jgi:hypothetical protein